jgi:hypothetical protein
MTEMVNTNEILEGKCEVRDNLEDLGADGRKIFKCMSNI